MTLPKPSPILVQEYLIKWEGLDNYVLQDKSLYKLFYETYPKNNNIEEVLIKVCSLNDFYSTNIYSPFEVAKHITKLDIDSRLEKCDLSLVNDISKVSIKHKDFRFYSFATKYCSHHNSLAYPIFDSYLEKVLVYYRNFDQFYSFKNKDLRDFEFYLRIIKAFISYYNLEQFNIKEMDQFLWLLGKEYFPRKYK